MRFPFAQLKTTGLLLLICLIGLVGCTSYRPMPNNPEAAPPMIMVDGDSLPTISFAKIFADIPGGRITGYHYEGIEYTRGYAHKWDENFNNESSDFNYLAMEMLSDAGYRAQDAGQGVLRLEGTIRELSYNSYSNKIEFDQVECDLRWHLFQGGEGLPFFTFETNGTGRVGYNKPGALKAAFELGLRKLLASPEFVEAVGLPSVSE